jgi:hypothetical protein
LDAEPGDVLTVRELRSAIRVNEGASPRARFESYLTSQQVDFVRAAAILFGGERAKVAGFYATDVNRVASKMQ